MNAKPEVSVVIATRDRPELLRRALASVRANDVGRQVEVIVVFDQSEPDPTLVDTDPDHPVRVVTNSRTPGLAGARNTGIQLATGRWVAFLDDDDEWMPTKLKAQLELLGTRPNARFATCGIAIRYRDTDHVSDHVRIPDPDRLGFDDFLADRMTQVHPSSFVIDRRWLLGQVGLVDEELPGSYAEDYDLLLRASRQGQIVSVPEPLVRVWWHRATYFRDRWDMIDSALGRLMDKYPEFARTRSGSARIRGQQAFARAASGGTGFAAIVGRTLRLNPLEPRAYLALVVKAGLGADRVLALLHRFGRGI